MTEHYQHARAGLLLGLGAYGLWGFMPLFFKLLSHVSATEIVAHRIIWSLVFLAGLATVLKLWPAIRTAMASPKILLVLVVTATLVSVNWLVYIYAVVSGHVLEGSLGYYLNPLVNVLLGVFLLKERLTLPQKGAVLLAACGVFVLALGAGDALWISLTLAVSFALYGFLRKVTPVDAVEGLKIETLLLMPIAIGWVIWLQAGQQSAFLVDPVTDALLMIGGVVTAIPLLLFNAAAKRLPYSTLGFLQYISPSIQFLLAVFLFDEPLTTAHLVCFGAIWSALAIFTVEGIRGARAAARARAEATP